jgi:hypothetical protein
MEAWSIYTDTRGEAILHRAGFSWLAAVALPVWALFRRLYKTSLVFALFGPFLQGAVASGIASIAAPPARGFLLLAWLIVWGFLWGHYANRWHRYVLEREGCKLTATEVAGATVR